MKAILTYRADHLMPWSNYNFTELQTLQSITDAIIEGGFGELINVEPFEHEIDNQCDFDNELQQQAFTFYLIMDLSDNLVNSLQIHEEDVHSEIMKKLREDDAYPQIIQCWKCGEEEFLVVDLDNGNPEFEYEYLD